MRRVGTFIFGGPRPLPRCGLRYTVNCEEPLNDYLADDRWNDVENHLGTVLSYSPELFIYIDDIDKNYAWAPSAWAQCQRGLFYAIMHFAQEDSPLRNKLHAVAGIRDITLATVNQGEGAPKYNDDVHICSLRWPRAAAAEFLQRKVAKLPRGYFTDEGSRTVESWLGTGSIDPDRPGSTGEGVVGYLIRHTRLVPRDVINLGNMICRAQRSSGTGTLSHQELKEVVFANAQAAVRSQLNVCASMILEGSSQDVFAEYDSGRPNNATQQNLDDKVGSLVSIIRDTGSEEFDDETRILMDQAAKAEFSSETSLSSTLWRNGLLG